MSKLLFIAIGGAVGAIGRHLTGVWMKSLTGSGHWGTLVVNLAGSFAIGILFWWLTDTNRAIPENLRLLVLTGVVGAFTTFSTFNLDAYQLFSRGQHKQAAVYFLASILGGLLLVVLGMMSGKQLFPR